MKKQQKENLYLKSKSHFHIISMDNDMKNTEFQTSNKEAILYLDLNLIDDLRKITYCYESNQRFQDKLSYIYRLLDILFTHISYSILDEKFIDSLLESLLKEINYLMIMTKSKLKNKKRKDDIKILLFTMEALNIILIEHRNEYKSRTKISSIKDNLSAIKSIKESFSIMANEHIDKEIKSNLELIKKKYNNTNFKFLFNNILSKYPSLTLECYHASFEHELSQEDKINYPSSLYENSFNDNIREKNTEYIDVEKMKKFLELNGYKISTTEKYNENYYVIYQIYCVQTLNFIYDFFINRHNHGKFFAVEELYKDEANLQRTMASDLILDAMISKITLNTKEIKFEGIDVKQMLIAISPKEKDKKLKNTVFDVCDILLSLFISPSQGMDAFYVSKDKGTKLLSLYNIDCLCNKFKITNNKVNTLLNNKKFNYFDNNISYILENGYPKIYSEKSWPPKIQNHNLLNRLNLSKSRTSFIKEIIIEYISLDIFKNNNYLNDPIFIKNIDLFFDQSRYVDVTYFLKIAHLDVYSITTTSNNYIDEILIPKICGAYLSRMLFHLSHKLKEKKNELKII